jgi:uncharacterized protein YqfB (UPF0267 family)
MAPRKQIPYAITNFESIRTEGYLYVDKTRFIEMLENEGTKYQFLIRPRKFGKTLFTSVLNHYYDIRFKDKFQELFGDLYIGQHPTPLRNSYFVMNFNFSGLDTSDVECFKRSFTMATKMSIMHFLTEHQTVIEDCQKKESEVWELNDVRNCLEYAFRIIKSYNRKAYVIIDEYDHFANDVIAKGTEISKNQYRESVWANSVTKDFYETLKIGTTTVVDKIFVTGITPIMLDDLTSGFNISNNLSLEKRYNEILGLTREEIEWVMEQIQLDRSLISIDIEKMYNGYLFHKKAENKLFNSTMIFYYLNGLLTNGNDFEYLIDDNLKTDYGRLGTLISKHNNKEKLRALVENKTIETDVIKQFSIEKIHDENNFFSLLYYMGLVTIDNTNMLNTGLKVPNYSVQTMYWTFIENMLTDEIEGLSIVNSKYKGPIYQLAYQNNYEPFFEYFSQNIVRNLSNRDILNTVEKDMKYLLLPMFFSTNYYFPVSELENSEGYTDLYLKRGHLYPGSVAEWVWELKYIKQADAKKEKLIAQKTQEAIEQLKRYKNSDLFKDRTDIRFLAIIFIGKKTYRIEEI